MKKIIYKAIMVLDSLHFEVKSRATARKESIIEYITYLLTLDKTNYGKRK